MNIWSISVNATTIVIKWETRESEVKVILACKFNPLGPDIQAIVQRNPKLLYDHPELKNIFPKGSILVVNKREKNLKELLQRVDPYSVKSDVTDDSNHGYRKCENGCDSCKNFVDETSEVICKATGVKYKIRCDSTCST